MDIKPNIIALSGTTRRKGRKIDFNVVRQKGSHAVLRRGDKGCVIPLHKVLAIGTLRNVIKQAGITADDFLNAFKNK